MIVVHIEGLSSDDSINFDADNDIIVSDGMDVTGFKEVPYTYCIPCVEHRAKICVGAVRLSTPAARGAYIRADGGKRWVGEPGGSPCSPVHHR
jgi:hypothetical protein